MINEILNGLRDFEERVPQIEKKTYLNKYPLPERCIGGSLFPGTIECVSFELDCEVRCSDRL